MAKICLLEFYNVQKYVYIILDIEAVEIAWILNQLSTSKLFIVQKWESMAFQNLFHGILNGIAFRLVIYIS